MSHGFKVGISRYCELIGAEICKILSFTAVNSSLCIFQDFEQIANCEDAVDTFYQDVRQGFMMFVPKKRLDGTAHLPWYTLDLRKLKNNIETKHNTISNTIDLRPNECDKIIVVEMKV